MRLLPLLCLVVLLLPPALPSRPDLSPGLSGECDANFLRCINHDRCLSCFAALHKGGVDWASVPSHLSCEKAVEYLEDQDQCTDLRSSSTDLLVFCDAFRSCIVWDDEGEGGTDDDDDGSGGGGGGGGNDDGGGGGDDDGPKFRGCDHLTECEWPGKHAGFVGDGICHDAIPGCYNHEVCNYDGGDCCADTCAQEPRRWDQAMDGTLVDCGQDGYACRDPASADCDRDLTGECQTGGGGGGGGDDDAVPGPGDAGCREGEQAYRLVQYDTWGDGWDSTTLVLTDERKAVLYSGGLEAGSVGTEYVCLSSGAACYGVKVTGGIFGNEVSWEVKALAMGAPPIASGGTPMECGFGVGGIDEDECPSTCNGQPKGGHDDDPEYKTYEDMLGCLKEKCIIQVGACQDSPTCSPCLADDTKAFCYADPTYNSLVDCALCKCDDEDADVTKEYCETKAAGGTAPSPSAAAKKKKKVCNSQDVLTGTAAVMAFAECSDVDSISAMVTNYDEDNFGKLDAFETCAHSYANDARHGGRKALDCMRVLHDAVSADTDGGSDSGIPTDAIAALAGHLYSNAGEFCGCASEAAKGCPTCENFVRFKVLLSETLDACQALDEIDCAAWSEFHEPCQANLADKFGSIDFGNQNQCDYVSDTCGGAGTFPAFRRLDCASEIPKAAWDFYWLYAKECLGPVPPTSGNKPRPPPPPVPAPTKKAPTPASPPTKKPTRKPYTPGGGGGSKPTPKPYKPSDGGGGGGPRPYVPEDDDGVAPSSYPSSSSKKKGNKLLWFVLLSGVVGGLYYKKKQSDAFDFVRYRRQRNWGGQSEMYTGLSMDNSCSFEPPTLPPTPAAMAGMGA